jgi:hypothetical protein
MVMVAQSAERRNVAPEATGSIPVRHPCRIVSHITPRWSLRAAGNDGSRDYLRRGTAPSSASSGSERRVDEGTRHSHSIVAGGFDETS